MPAADDSRIRMELRSAETRAEGARLATTGQLIGSGDSAVATEHGNGRLLRIAGTVLIVFGVLIIIANPVVIYTGGDSEDHPWEVDATYFYVQSGLGITLVLVGVFLYYLGRRKGKKEI